MPRKLSSSCYSRAEPRASTARLIACACLVGALGACVSSSDGDKLRAELNEHTAHIRKLEQAQTDQLEQAKQAETKAQKSIDELEGVIERATTVVQRNSADVTVQVSELQTKLAVVEGRMAELQFAIEELKKGAAASATASSQGSSSGGSSAAAATAESQIPSDKNEHYAAAYRAYSDRDFTKARTLFRAYIDKYKSDAQADNAQYWIGASYLVENRPATALAELRKVIENFRGGDAVDESLLDMAEAFYRLKACSDARTTLDTLIKTQPNSPLADKAKQKLKDMRKLPKDYCTS